MRALARRHGVSPATVRKWKKRRSVTDLPLVGFYGRLADIDDDKPAKTCFKAHPIGYFPIDLAEIRIEEGKRHLFASSKAALAAGQPERAAPRSSPSRGSRRRPTG